MRFLITLFWTLALSIAPASAQFYQTPAQNQNQINAVPWTNGLGKVTGQTIYNILSAINQTFNLYTPIGGAVSAVSNNGAVSTVSPLLTTSVQTLGFANASDGGGASYAYTLLSCALQGLTNDGLGCINSTVTSGSWVLVQPAVGVSAKVFGAKCDGVTNDTAAFTAAIADGIRLILPSRVSCVVTGLTLTSQDSLDCNNSTLVVTTPNTSALWAVKTLGALARVENCLVQDASYANRATATLTSAVAAGAYTLPVTSTTGFGCDMPIQVLLASGAYFPTKTVLSNCVSGSNLIITDPIPNSVTGVTVVSGGAGCLQAGANPSAMIAYGGSGVLPATFSVTSVSGGVIQSGGLSIQARGFYQTEPSNPVALIPSVNNPTCYGATANLTYNNGTSNGAAIGATVEGAYGEFVSDQGGYGVFRNNTVLEGTTCYGFYSTQPVSNPAPNNVNTGNRCNNFTLFGLVAEVNYQVSTLGQFWVAGTTHGGSAYGATGVYTTTSDYPSGAVGGVNMGGITVGNAEIGFWVEAANYGNNLVFDSAVTADNLRDYGFVCAGCNLLAFGADPWFSFTRNGVNAVFTNWTSTTQSNQLVSNVILPGMRGGNSAADIYLSSDLSASAVSLGCGQFSTLLGFWPVGNFGALTKFCKTFMQGSSGGTTLSAGTTTFMGEGVGSDTTTANMQQINSSYDTVIKMHVTASAAPGTAHSSTVTLYDNVTATPIACTIPAAGTTCDYLGPVPYIFPVNDLATVGVTPTSGAASASYRHVEGAE